MGEGDQFVENLSVVGDDCLFDLFFETGKNFGHADHVAAEVVDQDVVFIALVANVSELVVFAAENIDVAGALVKVVVGDALLTGLSVSSVLEAAADGALMRRDDCD